MLKLTAAQEAWFAERPPCIRQMAEEFPPGSALHMPDKTLYVMGWGEDNGEPNHLLVSEIDPTQDYDGAFANRHALCLCCARSGKVRH